MVGNMEWGHYMDVRLQRYKVVFSHDEVGPHAPHEMGSYFG